MLYVSYTKQNIWNVNVILGGPNSDDFFVHYWADYQSDKPYIRLGK